MPTALFSSHAKQRTEFLAVERGLGILGKWLRADGFSNRIAQHIVSQVLDEE